MVAIEHPMTSHNNQKDVNVSPQNIREAVVMSPEDEQMVKRQMAEMEAQAAELKEKEALLNDPVIAKEIKKKRALENLVLFNTPRIRTIKVGSSTMTMKVLSAHDSDQVYEEVLSLSAEDQITKTGRMLLSAALLEVDGIPLEDAYNGPAEITKPLLKRYYIINGWAAPLINNLNKAYQLITKELEKEFDIDFLVEP